MKPSLASMDHPTLALRHYYKQKQLARRLA